MQPNFAQIFYCLEELMLVVESRCQSFFRFWGVEVDRFPKKFHYLCVILFTFFRSRWGSKISWFYNSYNNKQ